MTTQQISQLKNQYIQLLRSTQRQGIENVITWLEGTDFYQAPASTAFHGDHEGGLLEHSMNVANAAIKVNEIMVAILQSKGTQAKDLFTQEEKEPTILSVLSRENILIASLLHDICKANIYKKEKRNRKVNGVWEEYDTYGVDYSKLPLGHGEKSVIILLQLGLKLTQDEMLAIRWHMTPWDLPFQSSEAKGNIGAAKDQCPLLAILQAADGLATNIIEAQ